jgi:hypothetical protein
LPHKVQRQRVVCVGRGTGIVLPRPSWRAR